MSAINYLKNIGIGVSVSETEKLNLIGLSGLPKSEVKKVLEYAKKNKGEILAELTMSEAESPIKFLGAKCKYVTYKDDPESVKLWCSLKDEAVINMPACPKDRWKKDEAGYQVSDSQTTDYDFYRSECRGCRDLYYFQDVCDTFPRAWCIETNCIVDFMNYCPNGKWERPKVTETIPDKTRCLSVECIHISYKQIDGMNPLFCGYSAKEVIELQKCPKGAWAKDSRGFQIPDNLNERMAITNGR